MVYEALLGQLEICFIILGKLQANKKVLSLMGQEQMYIKDWALSLGLSSRAGSTFLVPLLWPRRSPSDHFT